MAMNVEPRVSVSVTDKKMPPIIGLCGKAGHGKNSIADILTKLYGYQQLSFAGPLKSGSSELFQIPLETMENRNLKEIKIERFGASPRKILQIMGDVLRKNVDEDFLLKILGWKIEELWGSTEIPKRPIVITDVRFDKEAQLVHAFANSAIWKVDSSIRTPESILKNNTKFHSTEQGISSKYITAFVDNNGTIQDLEKIIMDIVPKE